MPDSSPIEAQGVEVTTQLAVRQRQLQISAAEALEPAMSCASSSTMRCQRISSSGLCALSALLTRVERSSSALSCS